MMCRPSSSPGLGRRGLRVVLSTLAFGLLLVPATLAQSATLWVATDGSDVTGDGSEGDPWASITHAVDNAPDGALVLVEPGTYTGRVRLRRVFSQGVTVRSQVPYQARLRNDSRVLIAYEAQGITVEGFDIAHTSPAVEGLVVHIQDLIDGPDFTRRITLRDNVLHDSFDNDLLKINFGAGEIRVLGNLFYNQSGSDEHIDINSASDVLVEGNVFFNDFEGSGRVNGNDTSSFIVIKDSDGTDGRLTGSRDITVRRNVFLHWQGSTGSNFVLIGEDGNPFFEARDVLVENNLMLGDSPEVMRAPFGVKGGKDVTFRHNTVVGDLPSLAYAFRLNTEGANPPNENIVLRQNVWSDPTGTMGAENPSRPDDFSDTPPGETASFTLRRNLYWNGPEPVPVDPGELINVTDDSERIATDPELPAVGSVVLPRWDPGSGQFADGSLTILETFERLATMYGFPSAFGPGVNAGDPVHAPADDLLGRTRDGRPDLGALEAAGIFIDGFESGDVSRWSITVAPH